MKKRLSVALTALVGAFLLVGAVSCSSDSDGIGSGTTATGKISGTVQYSNVDGKNHGGIMLTLDKTDGLRTVAVSQSVASRSVVSAARTIVASNVSSADGSYSFEGLQAGTYTVYAASSYSSERAVCTNVVVRAAETTIADVLKLTATGSIAGTVTIDGNASGNTGFLVFVAGTSYMAMTDNAGNYVISGVPAGKGYQVVATKNGVIHNLSSNVTVAANDTVKVSSGNFTNNEIATNMVWLGSYNSESKIGNPKYLNAYFNITDGCSYIYTGSKWELLARSGANGADGAPGEKGEDGSDGKGINWRGDATSSDEIDAPQELDAYYNTSDGCSYIYMWDNWQKLSSKGDQGEKGEQGDTGSDGKDGKGINWRGDATSSDEMVAPQELDAYYNTSDGCSYIYIWGDWQKLSSKGEKGDTGATGVSITWKGELETAPTTPELNWAYFNTTDGCSYIWNGEKWDKLSEKGATGEKGDTGETGVAGADGKSIVWKGELSSAPTEPELNWAYYNTTAGYTYIWNGEEWEVLAKAGVNGTSIVWKGELASAPENPKLYWAYYNTADGCSYLYNGTAWELLAKAGTDGLAGTDGTSISWLGSFASSSEITNPENLNAYYNTADGCSYIYNGTEWQLLSRKGSDGASGSGGSGGIIWLGDYADSSEITSPEVLSAYYNTTTGCSYIYNGTEWKLLAKGGTDGVDGASINWFGELPSDSAVENPKYLDAYYNTTNGCSYIYTGSKWELLAKSAPEQTTIEVSSTYNIGDVLLSDGTVIPYSASRVFTEEQKQKAVGVLYGNEFGIPCGWLGIYNSCGGTASGSYMWAKENTPGYETSFTDIVCDFENDSSVTSGSFTGDTDGSNNWSQICSVDGYAQYMIEKNYPAFNYVNKYATRFGLTGTYASGWYMPSFAELCFIYRNKTILNKVLSALGGTQLQSVQYWSSSQHPDWADDARYVNFSNGDASDGLNNGGKEIQKRVCVVYPFASDTTPPSTVSNLSATYDKVSKVITVSWINPYASDFAYVRISYSKDGTAIISNAPVYGNSSATASYTVNDVELDGGTYKFTVVALDKRGNKSTNSTISITLAKEKVEFTEFTIPTVNYLKEGSTVTTTITGKNFNTASLDPAINFAATCPSKPLIVSNTTFSVISDTMLTATFTITGKIGEYDITVSYGEKEITGTLKVQGFGTYTDGDVLLNDGTVIPYSANRVFTDEQKAKAVGVLYCDDYGVPKGWLGIHNSAGGTNNGTYAWAKQDSAGYNTKFNDIICTRTAGVFIGDTDGSDNWAYICDMYPVATGDSATNFPAFDYVNKYASTFNLTGDYAEGWYMPSIAELYYAFKSNAILNEVLSALDGTRLNASDYYWSSSQSANNASEVQRIYYSGSNVYVYSVPNSNTCYVCCVRAFE